jgi:hypothetical protein
MTDLRAGGMAVLVDLEAEADLQVGGMVLLVDAVLPEEPFIETSVQPLAEPVRQKTHAVPMSPRTATGPE